MLSVEMLTSNSMGWIGSVGIIDVDIEIDNLNVSDQTISDIKQVINYDR